MSKAELFVEIGSEEIPAGEVMMAVEFLRDAIVSGLDTLRLEHGPAEIYATPRRLAVVVPDVDVAQPDVTKEVAGPPVSVAFRDGQPTKAAEGFARGLGLGVDQLVRRETKKGEYLYAVVEEKGGPAAELLPPILAEALRKIPFKRTMRWGDGDASFVRPLQWIVALLGDTLLDVRFGDVVAGRESRGHRFLAPDAFVVTGGAAWRAELESRKVIADVAARRARIVEGAAGLAATVGGRLRADEGLIDEVTQLVEFPVPMLCRFDDRYLDIPAEVLISEMREHQRYLALVDEAGRLLPHFVVIGNTTVRDEAVVRSGYQRVLSARFADGIFFFEEDKKTPLAERFDALADMQFTRALGSLRDKAERSLALAFELAAAIEGLSPSVSGPTGSALTAVVEAGAVGIRALAAESAPEDPALSWWWTLARAGVLMKGDLLTRMVFEFPELQGVMGRAYAQAAGEPAAVAAAIEDHYRPRNAGDGLPESDHGALLGLADRLDTIVGIFATGKGPTGAADPFGLRRAALGVIHLLRGRAWHCSLTTAVRFAIEALGDKAKRPADEIETEVLDFVRGRLRGVLTGEGVPTDVAEAALAAGHDDVVDAAARAHALAALRASPDFEPIGVAFKRVANILKGQTVGEGDPSALSEPAEKALLAAAEIAETKVRQALETRAFDQAFGAFAELRPAVDALFDAVMVMDPNPELRDRRVALVGRVHRVLAPLADFTRLS